MRVVGILRAAWVVRRQKMSDVYTGHPTDEELTRFLKRVFEAEGGVSKFQIEIMQFLAERGCLDLDLIERIVPQCVEEAKRVLLSMQRSPQTALERR